MKEMVKQMCDNLLMGFITPHEFLLQYADLLRFFGAHKCVEDKMSELLQDFALDVANMLMTENVENNMIEHYGTSIFRVHKPEDDKNE